MSDPITPSLPPDLTKVDPDGGLLCLSMHWRSNPADPDPDMPGQKLSMLSYIPHQPHETCLCGSGQAYSACCQPKDAWHPVCPNPDMEGYSLLAPQSATFDPVDGLTLREQLTEDTRLYCVDEGEDDSFWIFWGDPGFEDQYGVLCFGDFELKENHTLLVTAMSNLRMENLLTVLNDITGDQLGEPEMSYEPAQVIDKRPYRLRRRARRGSGFKGRHRSSRRR